MLSVAPETAAAAPDAAELDRSAAGGGGGKPGPAGGGACFLAFLLELLL